MEQILVHALRFAYPNQVVFEDFSFSCAEGLFVLSGPSGCGKTTLLKILAGLLCPSAACELRVPERRRLILQDDGLFPWLTVEQNLALAGVSTRAETPAAISGAVALVEALQGKRAFELSFGERRTVELFRVLASQADFICLDEPFNFLDAGRRATFAACIAQLRREGVTFAISTHYDEDTSLLEGPVFKFPGSLPVRSLIPKADLARPLVE